MATQEGEERPGVRVWRCLGVGIERERGAGRRGSVVVAVVPASVTTVRRWKEEATGRWWGVGLLGL